MNIYYYSFEFLVPNKRWMTASVIPYMGGRIFLSHGMGRYYLADAGWHCSWCFPSLEDFQSKMASYSHVEHNLPQFRDPKRIQEYICAGKDLFDRWVDAYSFKELIQTWDGRFEKQNSVNGLPEFLVQNQKRFSYLIPGNCKRDL